MDPANSTQSTQATTDASSSTTPATLATSPIIDEHTPSAPMASIQLTDEMKEERDQIMVESKQLQQLDAESEGVASAHPPHSLDQADSHREQTTQATTDVESNHGIVSTVITITDEVNAPSVDVGAVGAAADERYSPEVDDSNAIHIQIRDAPIEVVEVESVSQEPPEVIIPIPPHHSRVNSIPRVLPPATQFVTIHNIDIKSKETPLSPHPLNTTLTLSPNTTRHLLAPVSKAYYKTVPYEILHLIATFLDGHSLSRLNRVDTASHTVTSKKDLWASLLEKPWNGDGYINHYDRAQLKGVSRVNQPREYYGLRYQAAMESRRSQLLAHDASVSQVWLSHRSFICHYLNDVLVVPTILLMFLLFTIFLVVQISRDESLTWFTCWPLIVIGSLLFFTVSLLYFKQWWFDTDGILSHNFYSDSTSFVKTALMDQLGETRGSHTWLWLMISSLSVFLFFLAFKLTGNYIGEWEWWKVFLPLYLVFALALISPLLGFYHSWGDGWCETYTPWLLSWIVFFGPLLSFMITLNVHLDDHPIRIMFIFIPLFILDLFVLIGLFVYATRDDDDYDECTSCCHAIMAGLAWLLLIGPFVTFQIILALKLDGESHMAGVAYHLTFIPLYFFQFLLAVISIYVGILHREAFDKFWDNFPHRPWVPIPEK